MQISLYEFFLTLVVGQCVFLIFAIQFIVKKNTGTNRMIQLLLAIYCIYLLERIVGPEIGSHIYRKYGYLYNVFYLFIGPFIYTYVRRLLFYEKGKYQLPYYHYLPVVFYFTYGVFHIYNLDVVENVRIYRTNLFFTVEILFFVSITIYLFKSYRIFNYYKKNDTQELSFNSNSVKYIQVMLFCLALYMLFWLIGIFELFDLVTWIERPLIYEICCLIFGIQIYIVSFYNLKYPEIFKIPYPSSKKNKSKKKDFLNEKEIQNIRELVKTFLEKHQGYRKPELSLLILANEIDTTTNKLSWVLNNSYKKTFYELVNEYRVADFAQKIRQNKHKEFTLISLAYEVGFNSKSTFYKAFKEITKMTPSQYIKQIKNSK
jgi:AraC-like DNA-binding protein